MSLLVLDMRNNTLYKMIVALKRAFLKKRSMGAPGEELQPPKP